MSWRVFSLFFAAVIVPLFLSGCQDREPRADLAITNVDVMTFSDEGMIENATLLVRDGKIASISKDWHGTAETIIDGQGGAVLPGLADMHVHLEWFPDDRVLWLFLLNGVTTLRQTDGRPEHLEWRNEIDSGARTGPHLIVGGRILEGADPAWDDTRVVASPQEGIAAVRDQHASGYDFIKAYHTLDAETLRAIAAEAKRLGLPVAGHVPREAGLHGAVEAGMGFVEHLSGYLDVIRREGAEAPEGFERFASRYFLYEIDEEKLADVAAWTARAGIVNTPTLSVRREFTKALEADEITIPQREHIPGDVLDYWFGVREGAKEQLEEGDLEIVREGLGRRQRLLRALHEAGAPLMIGTDTPQLFVVPGEAVHDEMEAFAAAGIPEDEVLETAITSPAKHFPDIPGGGRIETGGEANFILVDGDPRTGLAALRNVEGVYVGGAWLSREDILNHLAELKPESTAD